MLVTLSRIFSIVMSRILSMFLEDLEHMGRSILQIRLSPPKFVQTHSLLIILPIIWWLLWPVVIALQFVWYVIWSSLMASPSFALLSQFITIYMCIWNIANLVSGFDGDRSSDRWSKYIQWTSVGKSLWSGWSILTLLVSLTLNSISFLLMGKAVLSSTHRLDAMDRMKEKAGGYVWWAMLAAGVNVLHSGLQLLRTRTDDDLVSERVERLQSGGVSEHDIRLVFLITACLFTIYACYNYFFASRMHNKVGSKGEQWIEHMKQNSQAKTEIIYPKPILEAKRKDLIRQSDQDIKAAVKKRKKEMREWEEARSLAGNIRDEINKEIQEEEAQRKSEAQKLKGRERLNQQLKFANRKRMVAETPLLQAQQPGIPSLPTSASRKPLTNEERIALQIAARRRN